MALEYAGREAEVRQMGREKAELCRQTVLRAMFAILVIRFLFDEYGLREVSSSWLQSNSKEWTTLICTAVL